MQFQLFFVHILIFNTHLLKLFSINDEKRKEKGVKSAIGFV